MIKKKRKRKIKKLYHRSSKTIHMRHVVSFCGGVLIGLFIIAIIFLFPRTPSPTSMPKKQEIALPNNIVVPTVPFVRGVITHGSRDTKQIALTFDADMNEGMRSSLLSGSVKSYYDKQVIAILNQTKTKATIFLTGMWIELYPKEAKDLAKNPLLELANHSYSHPSFDGYCFGLRQISDVEDNEQVDKTQELLHILGISNHYFRFPGGCYSENDLKIVNNLGLEIVHWDAAGQDGFNNDVVNIENNVLNRVQNGSIIVLHINGPPNEPQTANALPVIITALKERGFHFVKLSELL